MYIEFCGGGAVDGIMEELEKPLTEPQIRCICHEMCEALDFLHQHFVIHRDLKAGNVLLTNDGQVRLGEFTQSDVVLLPMACNALQVRPMLSCGVCASVCLSVSVYVRHVHTFSQNELTYLQNFS